MPPTSAPASTPTSSAHSPKSPTPRLFHRLDWFAFAITTLLCFAGYFWTLAPDVTLEDAGELAVGSYYAGVPHPPGYPLWTLYSWLFTNIPIANIAWRVALSSAVAGALACGLLALLVCRGSSLMLEGIAEFTEIDRRWKSALYVIAGTVAGMLLGFNGFMWSQSVIVEVYPLSELSFMGVLCCLFRWTYAPDQRKYLYWAFFWFGVCFANHQTLVVAAMGLEVAILAAQPRLGRDIFIGNSIVYVLGLLAKSAGMITSFDANLPLFVIYNLVGLGSLVTAGMMTAKVGKPFSEWKAVLILLALWILGTSFYFYMPLASMTNPPMNWGYPRTVEGFRHTFTRGQYEPTNPTTSALKFAEQLWTYLHGSIDQFSLVYMLIGLVPFLFYRKMAKRERAWLAGLTAIFLCLGVLLLILLNPNTDLQSKKQARVFFTASHIVIAIAIGYGVALIGGVVIARYASCRSLLLRCAAAATGIELYYVLHTYDTTQLPTVRAAALLGLLLAGLFTLVIWLGKARAHLVLLLTLLAAMPARSILAQWADNEQRGHLFGYWFGHDMFSPPFGIYPEMAREAVLFGGTDPGRFIPTYMIFCESFIPPSCKPLDPKFNRRDVAIITQNALADVTYPDYIRAHYNRSAQKDPYFFSELFRTASERERGTTNFLSRALLPLDHFFTGLGERIETARRERGVYPAREVITMSREDNEKAMQEYVMDAARRLQHDMQAPNEPRQIKPGEGVRFTTDGRVQVSGQLAVMGINAVLAKIIFDKNPDHEFYVEESMPLDWMFPHLTPFGIIMKVNRGIVPAITEEMMRKDHEFWSRYSDRLTGNWITYDTPVKDVCEFAERIHLRHDFTGFMGDPRFARDDAAQKAFSKLRCVIGFLYSWRISAECPQELRAKGLAEQQRLLKEAEFAYKQAYAFCPDNGEALHKYVTLLLIQGRVEEARLLAQTSLRFDPDNPMFQTYYEQLKSMGGNRAAAAKAEQQFAQLEQQFQTNPANVQAGLQLASAYAQLQQPAAAAEVLEKISADPHASISILLSVAQVCVQLGLKQSTETVIKRIEQKVGTLAQEYQANTNNVAVAFQLISGYLVAQQTNQAMALVDELVSRPQADGSTFLSAAQVYNQLQQWPKLERALQRLVTLVPANAEAWYDLAAVQAFQQKPSEAIASLRKALQLNQPHPGGKDLRAEVAKDGRFAQLHSLPEFQALAGK